MVCRNFAANSDRLVSLDEYLLHGHEVVREQDFPSIICSGSSGCSVPQSRGATWLTWNSACSPSSITGCNFQQRTATGHPGTSQSLGIAPRWHWSSPLEVREEEPVCVSCACLHCSAPLSMGMVDGAKLIYFCCGLGFGEGGICTDLLLFARRAWQA